MRKKLKDTGGLTMVELLCATAILVLLCLMMNTGIGMAVKTYQGITAKSEVELLLGSLTEALTDKLRYCVVYESGNYSVGKVELAGGMVTVGGNKLLPDGAYGIHYVKTADGSGSVEHKDAYIGRYNVTKAEVTPTISGTTATFKVELAVENASGDISASTPEGGLTVRCLNPVKKEE